MDWLDIANNLGSILDGECKIDEPLNKHTTWKIGGPANILVMPGNKYDIIKVCKFADKQKIPLQIIGNGSNILILDDGFKGIIIKLANTYKNIKFNKEYIICESGVFLPKLVNYASANSFTGVEFLAGIPGTVGGAVYMNAGAYGSNIGNLIEKVEVCDLNGKIRFITKEELSFSYRYSNLQEEKLCILNVYLKLKQGNKEKIKSSVKEYLKNRRFKQPLEYPNAGSVFVNPKEYTAGFLIQESGLKGIKKGGAKISEKHANFIINIDKATANDILQLIELIKGTVYKKYGIDLETEIKTIG